MDFLRHAYCVHRLARWVRTGQDLTNLLPYLAVYLGHADFRGTEYYLRLTADLYPELYSESHNAATFFLSLQQKGTDRLANITEAAVLSVSQ